MTFTIEPWDPAYGMAFNAELDDDVMAKSSAELDLDLEVKASLWQPVDPDPATRLPAMVNFLDGVRRIDAWVWVHQDGTQPVPGIAASLAAGLVSCDGQARITDVTVERGLFTSAAEAVGIVTSRVRYPAYQAPGRALDQLSWPCSSTWPGLRSSSRSGSVRRTHPRTICLSSTARCAAAPTCSERSAT